MISGLQGDVTVSLPHLMIPIHTSHKWGIGFDGSTIEVPIPAFQCGTKQIVVDLDALARLLVDTYGMTPNVLAAIQGKDLTAVLQALAVVIQQNDRFAKGVAQWFVGKLAELGTLPVACDMKPNTPFDIFSIGELANWKIVSTTGRVPRPAFVVTGESVGDGEMDTDGAVHSASALGFTLGRVPFYFEHNRTDDGGKGGSWYRLYDNPVKEKYNHGQQYQNDVGLWVRAAFLAQAVGPVPAPATFSVWPP